MTTSGQKKRSRKDKSKEDYDIKNKKQCRNRKYSTVWKMATTQQAGDNDGPNK
jgi:hypothetical protein